MNGHTVQAPAVVGRVVVVVAAAQAAEVRSPQGSASCLRRWRSRPVAVERGSAGSGSGLAHCNAHTHTSYSITTNDRRLSSRRRRRRRRHHRRRHFRLLITSTCATRLHEQTMNIETSTSVFGDGRISTHADLRPHAARYSTNGASVA